MALCCAFAGASSPRGELTLRDAFMPINLDYPGLRRAPLPAAVCCGRPKGWYRRAPATPRAVRAGWLRVRAQQPSRRAVARRVCAPSRGAAADSPPRVPFALPAPRVR
jgi:hypothetical protein